MNILDVTILIVLLSSAARWAKYGFSRGALSFVGYWLGILIGVLITPYILQISSDPFNRLLLALFTILFFGMTVGTVGKVIGIRLYKILRRFQLGRLDSLFGILASVVITLLTFWIIAGLLKGTQFRSLNMLTGESRIIQAVNNTLPPAPTILSRIAALLGSYDFPQVFIGREPRPIAPTKPPSSNEIAAALAAAGRSTVRIESIGCGGNLFGTGFVVAENLVMTNAHVVAGIDEPSVRDIQGEYRGRIVYFNPDIDIAIIRVNDLAGSPLNFAPTVVADGTSATTLGYPGGGSLEAVPASVLEEITARGRNIYGTGISNRPVYSLQTQVVKGNSGGPVVLSDGTVVGIIFAQSVTYDNIGYAITSPEALRHLRNAQANNSEVDSGQCLTD